MVEQLKEWSHKLKIHVLLGELTSLLQCHSLYKSIISRAHTHLSTILGRNTDFNAGVGSLKEQLLATTTRR